MVIPASRRWQWRPGVRAAFASVVLAAASVSSAGSPTQGSDPSTPVAAPASQPAATSRPAAPSVSTSRPAAGPALPGTWLDEVVVTASRQEVRLRELPAAAIVVRDPAVRQPEAKTFLDALANQPGVKVGRRQDGGIFGGDIEIRGLNTNSVSGGNVLILLDGIPQRRLSFGGPYMGAIPFEAVTRMELVKGPLSVQYGRGALAGAIQLFTDPGSSTFSGETQTTYDTASRNIRSWLRLGGPVPGMEGSTCSLTTSGGYADGWQERTEAGKGFLYWHANLQLTKRDELEAVAGYYQGCEHVASPVLIDKDGHRLPGIDRDTNLGVPGQNGIDLTEYRLGTTWTHHYEKSFLHKLTLALWDGDTEWKVGRPSDAPAAGTVVSRMANNQHYQERAWFSELQFQKDYELGKDVSGAWTAGGTLEYQTYDNSNQNIRVQGGTFGAGIPLDLATRVEPPRSTWVYGPVTERETRECDQAAFLSNRTTFLDRLTVEAGARFDHFRRRQTNLTNGNESVVSDAAVSPGAGLSYRLLGQAASKDYLAAYTNWGEGFFPVFRGVSSTEILVLRPETSESYEVGLKGAALDGRVSGSLAAYRMLRNDVVGLNAATATQENIGDWDIRGIESDLRARPADWLDLYGSYTFRCPDIARNDAAPQTVDNQIPFVAAQMFKLGAEVNHQRKLFVGADLQWTGQAFADEANLVSLPAHCEVNAHVCYKWQQYTLTFFVRNIFNQEYFCGVFNGVVNGSAFEGEPRTFGVTLAAKF